MEEETLVRSLPRPRSSEKSAILGKFSAVVSVVGFSCTKPYINLSPFWLCNSKLVNIKENEKLIGSADYVIARQVERNSQGQ